MLKFINNAPLFLALIPFALWFGYSLPIPSKYFEVHSVVTLDHDRPITANTVIEMDVVREIHQTFQGEYLVTVRRSAIKRNGEQGWTGYCRGRDNLRYETDAALPPPGPGPDDLNLGWWIYKTEAPDCSRGVISVPGDYYIQTCWKIQRPFTYPIWTCEDTEPFTVVEEN